MQAARFSPSTQPRACTCGLSANPSWILVKVIACVCVCVWCYVATNNCWALAIWVRRQTICSRFEWPPVEIEPVWMKPFSSHFSASNSNLPLIPLRTFLLLQDARRIKLNWPDGRWNGRSQQQPVLGLARQASNWVCFWFGRDLLRL